MKHMSQGSVLFDPASAWLMLLMLVASEPPVIPLSTTCNVNTLAPENKRTCSYHPVRKLRLQGRQRCCSTGLSP